VLSRDRSSLWLWWLRVKGFIFEVSSRLVRLSTESNAGACYNHLPPGNYFIFLSKRHGGCEVLKKATQELVAESVPVTSGTDFFGRQDKPENKRRCTST